MVKLSKGRIDPLYPWIGSVKIQPETASPEGLGWMSAQRGAGPVK